MFKLVLSIVTCAFLFYNIPADKAVKEVGMASDGERNKKFLLNIIGKLIKNGVISLVLSGVGLFAIVYAFPFFFNDPSDHVDWSLLEGYASVISLALLIGGATFAISEYIKAQLAEEREKSKLSYEIYQAIFAKITDPEQEAARRWILNNIYEKEDGEDLAIWFDKENAKVMPANDSNNPTEGQRAIKLTLNAFDYIGFIADHFWDVDEDALDWISAPIAKVWLRLGPYVERVQELRGVRDYYLSAQSIGSRCVAWRESKGWKPEKIAKDTP